MKRVTLFFIISIQFLTGFSQKELEFSCDVKPVSSKLVIDGRQLFYALPKNIIRVEFEIKKTTQIEGPYSGFALKYLNISEGTIQVDDEYYSIISAKIHRISQIDSSRFYAVSYEGFGGFPMLQLNTDGVLIACNANDVIEGYTTLTSPSFTIESESESFAFFDFGVKPFLEDFSEIESKANKGDSTIKNEPTVPIKMEPKTVEQNAEEAADYIRKIRKRRMKVAMGYAGETFPVEGESMKKMIEELDTYEKKYLELFMGKTIERSNTYYFDFEPDNNSSAEQQVIGWFSRSKGLEMEKSEIRKNDFQPIVLSTRIIGKVPDSQIQATDPKQKSSYPLKHGLFYRIPGRIDVVIKYTTQILIHQQMEVAQKGSIIPMPVDYLNNPIYSIEFYPETGALKRIYLNK